MNPILYEANTTSFTTNGLGRLSDCISCVVQEVLNGIYELEMVYPIDGVHYSLIEEHRILYVPHDDTKTRQPFEIYRISKPINGKVTINAWHISYRLRKMVCKPFTASSAADAMDAIENNIVGTNPFTFATDKSTSVNKNQRSPVIVKSLMGGMQGSIIDVYGGEWEYNNYVCTLRNRRGVDTDVSIRYGKNLTDVKKVSDTSNLWTGVIPYWEGTDDEDNEIQVYYNGVIYSSVHEDYPYEMIITLDVSADFEEQPTQAQLQTRGQSYVTANARSMIPTSIDISFIQLWQTEEYKNVAALQRLFIGDAVHVYYEKLGIDNVARIVSYKYNVLLERYDSMTLGEVRSSFSSAVKGDIDAVLGDIESNIKSLPTKSFVDRIVEHQTDLIRGGLGGYVVLGLNANGEPEETLYMDTDDITTAVNVLRINKNGIGFSTSGYGGSYTNAWTIDGILNADFISAGTMLANRIKGGTLSLGGVDNGDGVLKVYNASGTLIGQWDKDGIDITSGTINGPTIITKGGNDWSILDSGYLKGGTNLYSSTTECGYISFNQYFTNTGRYGARLAGRAMVAILTPVFGVGDYANYGAGATIYQGTTRNVRVVTGENAPTVTVNLSTYHMYDVAQCDASGNVYARYNDVEIVSGVTVSVTPNPAYSDWAFKSGLFSVA